jgi:YHS domain-containing protein
LVGGNGAKFVILTCPICGKEFRRHKSVVDGLYERTGQTHFYCSRECFHESIRKSHKSEYEENIARIRKEQRL